MKILILRFSSLGDILLATPVITVLKQQWPDCTIEWVVKEKFQAALSVSQIDKIHTFGDNASFASLVNKLRTNQYDLVFDLHRNFKSWQIRRHFKNVYCYEKRELRRLLLVWFKIKYPVLPIPMMYFQALHKAGIKIPDCWDLIFEVGQETADKVLAQFSLNNQKYLALAPGASYFTKRWPQNYFEQLVKVLVADYRIVILGNGSLEEQICKQIAAVDDRVINLSGCLSFSESAAVIKNSLLLVSNDSGLLHLAECFKTPVVGIFGSTTEELGFFPYATDYRIVENKQLTCRPCSHFGRRKCPRGDFACMQSLLPEMVHLKIKDLLRKKYD